MGIHQEFHFRISDQSVQFCEGLCGGSVGEILDPCVQNEFIHYLGKVNQLGTKEPFNDLPQYTTDQGNGKIQLKLRAQLTSQQLSIKKGG